ncbi:hypothetical protein F5878DRAFT_522712, partial [Lentinula raphanica]
ANAVSTLASRIETIERQMLASANVVRSPEKKCRNCQRTGHVAEDCFRKGGGKEGQYPSWWKGKRDNQNTSSTNPTANAIAVPEVGELTQHYGLTASSEKRGSGEIFADTGASDHFFRNREDFVTY